jgi:hypothetical protein
MTRPSPAFVRLLVGSAIATALTAGLLTVNLARTGHDAVDLLLPGGRGPSAAAIRTDFPNKQLDEEIGSDGQQFYAIARDPLHPRRTAPDLDRPQYRLQRILYPALAWAAAGGARGRPLVFGLVAVNLAGVFIGCLAFGVLATAVGRSPASALAFAALPGVFLSVRMSAADALALALSLVAIALLWHDRPATAAVATIAAVLTKESSYLLVAAMAIDAARRRNVDVRATLIAPVVIAASGWVALRVALPVDRRQYVEFALPFVGLVQTVGYWLRDEPAAGLVVVATIALGIAALVRAPRGPFALALATQLAFLAVLSKPTFQFFVSGPRTVLPLSAIALLSLLSMPSATRVPCDLGSPT